MISGRRGRRKFWSSRNKEMKGSQREQREAKGSAKVVSRW